MQLINRVSKANLAAGIVLAVLGTSAIAGTSGPEFGELYNTLLGWTEGFLGKSLAFAAFLFGAGFGVAKQTIVPAIMGIVFALIFAVGPSVITGMMTAVI
jgi:conjugal transfer pilus assembly protein TraA